MVTTAAPAAAIELTLGREHPTVFAKLTRRNYDTALPHWRIGDALRKVEAGAIRRLIVEMPPRHGKSTLTSVTFPAWYLGRNPDHRVIAASYGDALSRGFGRGARNIIMGAQYQRLFPGIRVSADSSAANAWNVDGHDGGFMSTSIGGAITGFGGNVMLIDDPVKSRAEADSEVQRENTWDWYTNDAYTRLEKDGAIVLILTRWHEDDLAGRLLEAEKQGGEHWEVVRLPALSCATCGEYPHATGLACTGEYEALWPQKFDVPALENIRAVQGSRAFESLYQQNPSAPEGVLFRRAWMTRRYAADWMAQRLAQYRQSIAMPPAAQFNAQDLIRGAKQSQGLPGQLRKQLEAERARGGPWGLPPGVRWRMVQTVDTATREGAGADWSVIATWATDGISYYLVNIWRKRVDYPALKAAVAAQYFEYYPGIIYVEDTTHGRPLVQELKNGTGNYGIIPVAPVPAIGNKVTRAEAQTPKFEAMTVVLPEEAPWLDDWLLEHLTFPNSMHDDQVDTTSLALQYLSSAGSAGVQRGGRVKV